MDKYTVSCQTKGRVVTRRDVVSLSASTKLNCWQMLRICTQRDELFRCHVLATEYHWPSFPFDDGDPCASDGFVHFRELDIV